MKNLCAAALLFLAAVAAASAEAAELPLIRIAHGAYNEKIAAIWVGVEQGFFRKQGLNVEVINIRSGPQTIYAGDNSGAVSFTHDNGAHWTTATGLPGRWVTDIAVDPTAPNTAYVTFGGFNAADPVSGHVFKTTDGGTTWTGVGSLPDAPLSTVAIDQSNPQIIYVGGDIGVYKSTDGGATWATLNAGLPNAPVWHIVISRDGSRMFAVTHGRSVFMATRTSGSATATPTAAPTTTPTATPGSRLYLPSSGRAYSS